VGKGQVIARLSLPELAAELRGARAALATLEAEHRQLSEFGTLEERLQSDALAKQRDIAAGQIAAGRQRQGAFTRKLATQRKLLADGLVTEQELQATRDALADAEAEVRRAEGTLVDLTVKEAELRQRVRRESGERAKRIADARRRVAETEQRIGRDSTIVSPSDGRVIEVRAAVGSVVSVGTPVVLVELTGACLEGILYVPGSDGKRIQPGMAVEVSPSTVKREEYGSLRATVTSVSPFPSTQRAMLANLGNEELVGSFFRSAESPIEVRVDVAPSPGTPSGLSWTSPKGPPAVIEPGTLCSASISVRERRPISFVLPILRERAGL
jgi:HlyD family secretion protein